MKPYLMDQLSLCRAASKHVYPLLPLAVEIFGYSIHFYCKCILFRRQHDPFSCCQRQAGAGEENGKKGMTLTFKAFLAASASDRLSKLTNPTGWGDKETEQKNKKTRFKAEV